ncbi:MAG: FprA family A-type flavoprotein [Bacillota bacterium]
MQPVQLKPDVYWVGGIDWDLRYFHGYLTPRGTTYNAYLIIDEHVTLVDTVKHYMADEMMERIRHVCDPADIDYVVANHVEMDHSGSLPRVLEAAPGAEVLTSPRGREGLIHHYGEYNYRVVPSGGEVSIGDRTLTFVHTPMVHWPDSMVTYIGEDRLLLPNDAFGQHIASYERFDDEIGWDVLHEEAAKYYANIVLPYGLQVSRALDALADLPIDMIGPSHGVVWRKFLPQLLQVYPRWARHETERRALIVYDTMWESTARLAVALRRGLESTGTPVTVRTLQNSHMSEIMTDVLTSRALLIGTPTLNNGMLPSVAGFLTYLKGLKPQKRLGLAFGSYGWSGQGAGEVHEFMESMGWEAPIDFINVRYRPTEAEIEEAEAAGRKLGEILSRTPE